MAIRHESVEPSKSGQQTNAKGTPNPKVKVKSNMSKVKNSGIEDALHAALLSRGIPLLPTDNHVWTHTTRVEPAGAHYNPRGSFGEVAERGKNEGVYDYGEAPDHEGKNALGNAMNKVGERRKKA